MATIPIKIQVHSLQLGKTASQAISKAVSEIGYLERLTAAVERLKHDNEKLTRGIAKASENAARHFAAHAQIQRELVLAQGQAAAVTDDFETERANGERLAAEIVELQKRIGILEQDVELRDQQLEARDRECDELTQALAVAKLPIASRNNVIDLLRDAA
jgi:chromosome segregation ATPase